MVTTSKPILIPTDFGPHSQLAFDCAQRLANDAQCDLIAMHVCNIPDYSGISRSEPSHHDRLRHQLDQHTSDCVEVRRLFFHSDPAPEICRVAEDEDVRFVIMGVTNKHGYDQLCASCVHDYVVANAPCPVLTLCLQADREFEPAR